MAIELLDGHGHGFGKVGVCLLSISATLKGLKEYVPSMDVINEWVIFATAIVALILLVFRVFTQREDLKMKRLERKEKERELDQKNSEGHSPTPED